MLKTGNYKKLFLSLLLLVIALFFLPAATLATNKEIEPNDSLSTATPIDLGTWYSGEVIEWSYDVDYFKFTIPSDGKVELIFNNDGATNARPGVSIQNGKGESYAGFTGRADLAGDEKNHVYLPKGEYYVAVDQSRSYRGFNYKVKVNFTAGDYFEKEFNDNLSSANLITIGKEYTGRISESSANDYYKVKIDKPGKFTACINTKGASSTNKITLAILDGKNNYFNSVGKQISLVDDECIHTGLDAGEYYVLVNTSHISNYGFDYRIKTKFEATDFYEKEHNDNYASANDLKLNQKYTGDTKSSRDNDYFKFILDYDSKVTINMDHNSKSNLKVILTNGKDKQYLNHYVKSHGVLTSEVLPAGEYFVIVDANYNNGITYSFSVNTEKVERISGTNRYNTAVEVSKAGWDIADTVILTRGDNFADALAGVPLAYQLDAPILMTPSNKLPDETWKEIERLGAKKAIILGGTGAVSDDVKTTLEYKGLKVERISGSNRTETAVQIAKKMFPEGTNKAVVANGMDFPDALSVASYAAKDGMPILLTQSNKLSKATAQVIKDLGVRETIVVGGKGVVSENVKKQLPSSTRLGGKDRYATNIALAKHFGVDNKHIYAATGTGFADALTGAVLAAKNDSAIVLVHHRVPSAVSDYLTADKPEKISIFGGKGAVSDSVVDALNKLVK